MKKVILALILLMMFVSCGYASTRHPRSCGEITVSSAITALILTVIQWAGRGEDKHNEEEPHSSSSGQAPPPHGHDSFSSTEQSTYTEQDAVSQLVNLGLACIGRRSQYPNPYFTSAREAERHRAEYIFLRQLAGRYHDAEVRKVLAKHFMLFKEVCLYIAFSSLLKNDTELHIPVKEELNKRLTEGLGLASIVRRKDYMYAFSKAFYEEYKRTHDMAQALGYMFWSVAASKYPSWVQTAELHALMGLGGLLDIYTYTYSALKEELG
ncbi:MAG: hypothetical protein IJS28_07225 [Synergistaceae bacterium]|nr:hypothetical protein [Synergistaceae bacterium]